MSAALTIKSLSKIYANTEINIALGDKIKQGDVLLALQTEQDNADTSEESVRHKQMCTFLKCVIIA
jgi:hypothetical protein